MQKGIDTSRLISYTIAVMKIVSLIAVLVVVKLALSYSFPLNEIEKNFKKHIDIAFNL